MNKVKRQNRVEGGYTILELLFYISLFAVLSMVVINSMIIMTQAFRETALQAELLQGGSIMERISREIRQAYDINTISASDLKLNTTDSAGANKTVEFVLSGTDVHLLENNTLTGNLNTPNIIVTALSFTQSTGTVGKAIKVSFTVKSSRDRLNRTVNFYDTIVLRGSY